MKRTIPIVITLLAVTAAAAAEPRLQVEAWRPGTKDKRAANRARIVELPAGATQPQITSHVNDPACDGLKLGLALRPVGTPEACKLTVDEICRLLGSQQKSSAEHDGSCGGICVNGWGLDLRLVP